MANTNSNKLTDTAVKSAKPKDAPYKLSDGGGMYLLVKHNGGKYWHLAYRFNNKQKLLALGVYPEVSLKEARLKRDEAKKLLQDGIDPRVYLLDMPFFIGQYVPFLIHLDNNEHYRRLNNARSAFFLYR